MPFDKSFSSNHKYQHKSVYQLNTLFHKTCQNACNHFHNRFKSYQYTFHITYLFCITKIISNKSTLVNYYFRQGSRIIFYTWSHYLIFRLLYQQHLRTYKFVLVAQTAKLYTLISTHKSATYHHVARTLLGDLDSLCAHKS